MLIRNADLGSGQCIDLRVKNGKITELGVQLAAADDHVIDAAGNALIPSLHDHHIHLLALAASLESIDCGAADIDSRNVLADRLRDACAEKPGEIRGVNYFAADDQLIDRAWLDEVCGAIPTRIQHRSGRLWILNTAALANLGHSENQFPETAERDAAGRLNGRLYHMDDWLRDRRRGQVPSLAGVSAKLAACGITGITDAGADNDDSVAALLAAAQQRGELLQSVLLMGNANLSVTTDQPQLRLGAQKIYLKEAALPDFDVLCESIDRAHKRHRNAAFHCVTRVELQFAISALEAAGVRPGDRIEHASIADDAAIEQLQRLNITVVTQPHFIVERGDSYAGRVDAQDVAYLYRGRAFLDAGVAFAAGSDAPFGHYDPWQAMTAAVNRCSRNGQCMGADDRLTPEQALALFTSTAAAPGREQRCIEVGTDADLCLLAVPRAQMLADLSAHHVQRVWRGGELIFQR